MNASRCTCYVENCSSAIDRLRRTVTAVVDCPKHSTATLRELLERGRAAARAYGAGRKNAA